ncbi:hypothetical protein ABBQ32_007537 [Trebouxia sp. C0010 RCD-2024]
MADVKLVVGKDSYSAHSQILAYRSDLILSLLEGCPNVSPEEPLVIRGGTATIHSRLFSSSMPGQEGCILHGKH